MAEGGNVSALVREGATLAAPIEFLRKPKGAEQMTAGQELAVRGGSQCGYCTPGMLLVAEALLAENAAPTREQIVDALSGNFCRCTGYVKIFEAVELAAERQRARRQVSA